MKNYIRYISLILCIVMVLCSAPECFAAAPTATTSIVLSQADGTVTVRNASGKAQKTKENMKLYNGFTVATSDKSYAYIDLGDLKYVKLDASSEAEIKMSGKKLEVLLKSGEIFFDVDEKLKNDESFKIRAGKTTTNIRGTAGQLSAGRIVLLNGKVTSTNAQTGQSFFVDAGYTLEFTETNQQGEVSKIENLKDAVSGFTATEIENNESLAEKIAETFGEEAVQETAQAAEEKLAEDQQQAEEEKAAADAEAEESEQPTLSVLATDEDGNIGLAEDAESTADYNTIVQEEAAMAYYDPTPVSNTVTLTLPQDIMLGGITIAAFSVVSGAAQSTNKVTVERGTRVVLQAEIYYDGSQFVQGGFLDDAVLSLSLDNYRIYTYEITLQEDYIAGDLTIDFYTLPSNITANVITSILSDPCYNGLIIGSGFSLCMDNLTIPSGKIFGLGDGSSMIDITVGALTCNGGLMINNNASMAITGNSSNSGVRDDDNPVRGIINNGTLVISSGASIENSGSIENWGTIINRGSIDNQGTINNSGIINSYSTATFIRGSNFLGNEVEIISE